MKQWLIVGAILLVLLVSYIWNRSRNFNGEGETIPPVEEIITQEGGQVVRRRGEVTEEISPEEAEQRRQEISERVADVEPVVLTSVESETGNGSSFSTFEEGTYYQRIQVEGMAPLQKGYFYEAWLEQEDGTRVSIGRLDMTNGSGELFYSALEDRTTYPRVVVSREVEDGNAEIGERVLVGTR